MTRSEYLSLPAAEQWRLWREYTSRRRGVDKRAAALKDGTLTRLIEQAMRKEARR